MEAQAQSDVGRRRAGEPERKRETFSLDPKTKAMLDAYSERTGVPMSRVIDFAVVAFMKDKPEGQEPPTTQSKENR